MKRKRDRSPDDIVGSAALARFSQSRLAPARLQTKDRKDKQSPSKHPPSAQKAPESRSCDLRLFWLSNQSLCVAACATLQPPNWSRASLPLHELRWIASTFNMNPSIPPSTAEYGGGTYSLMTLPAFKPPLGGLYVRIETLTTDARR